MSGIVESVRPLPEYYDFLNGAVKEEPDWAQLHPRRWERGLLTPTEAGIPGGLANAAGRAPTERQAAGAVETLNKLQSEGYAGELPS